MIKSKKQMFIVIGSFILIMLLGTTTYAFFNYTRTGSSNTIKVGRIAFNTEQTTINIDNVFPIDSANIDNETDYVGTTTIHITGDTTYTEGIEYLVTAEDVINTTNNKKIPINIDVSYTASENKTIGTSDDNYFTNRNINTSSYVIINDTIKNSGARIAAGHIKPDASGIDGTITIKAYIDKDKVAITDTYDPYEYTYVVNKNMTAEEMAYCEEFFTSRYSSSILEGEDVIEFCEGTGTINNKSFQKYLDENFGSSQYGYYYTNPLFNAGVILKKYENTTDEWLQGRTRFTTTEWNNLQESGISFKIKVEANEGIWIEKQKNAMNTFPGHTWIDERDDLLEIQFVDMPSSEMHTRYNNASGSKYDLTYNGEGEVLAWLEPNETDNTKYTMIVASDGTTYFTTGSALFAYYDVEKIEFHNVNTSRVTTMADMFYSCDNLKEVDLSGFDTSNVSSMNYLVARSNSIEKVNLSGLDMRKVESMAYMFANCPLLEEVNFTGSQTRDLRYVNSMFEGTENIEYLDLSNFGGDNLYSLDPFDLPDNLKTLIMRNFNFGSTTSIYRIFYGNPNLETIDLTGADFSKVDFTNQMLKFTNSPKLKTIIVSPGVDFSNISNYDTNNMFSGCTSLVGGDGTTYDSSHIDSSYAKVDGADGTPGYFTVAE